jgi:lipopolysaccharide export system permease protein
VKLIDRHIGRTVLGAICIVLLAFGGITTLFPLIDELAELDAGYGMSEALTYVVLTTPRRLYELMPYVAFMGALVALGMLANHSELVVLRASGMSIRRIFASVALTALPVMALTFATGEWLAPWGEASAEALKARAKYGQERPRRGEGLWYREGNLFMSVSAVDPQGTLIGVQQYQLDEARALVWTRSAVSARFIGTNGDGYWLLENVTETRFDADRPLAQRHGAMQWNSRVDPRLLTASVQLDPHLLRLDDLRRQIAYLRTQDMSAEAKRVQWLRMLQIGKQARTERVVEIVKELEASGISIATETIVRLAEHLTALQRQRIDAVPRRHVGRYSEHGGALGQEGLLARLQAGFVYVGHDHVHARRSETLGQGEPDATRGTCHHRRAL